MEKSYYSAGVAVIVNNFLASFSHCLGLYADALAGVRFDQTSEVNSLITKTINSSTFMVLGGDFNENGFGKNNNSRRIERTIDYIFVSRNLASAVVYYVIGFVSGFFDTDHKTVIMSIGLDGFLDGHLNSLHKQANKDYWKFNIKDADSTKWAKFKDCVASKLLLAEDKLSDAEAYGKMDAIWVILKKCSRNRHSSRFFGLEMLAAKIVKKFNFDDANGIDCLMKTWSTLNKAKANAFTNLILLDNCLISILKHLSLVRKSYKKSKMHELRLAEEASIRKVVLDHLVVDDKLVVELIKIKSNMDRIMKTLPNLWACQYMSLNYVKNNTFSEVMHPIGLSKLLLVIGGLPDRKTAGLSGIPNELWKHGSNTVVGCLLRLLNVCLNKRAWVLIIPKPYNWNGVLTNTHPIALIEISRKILSKVLSDHCYS
ncbi:hypothetical protein G9A89_010984 [Geosiphon pyriformis]|nr:hypothetical protein G9A89_010984 [Geosiphon pyriformis]